MYKILCYILIILEWLLWNSLIMILVVFFLKYMKINEKIFKCICWFVDEMGMRNFGFFEYYVFWFFFIIDGDFKDKDDEDFEYWI